jgi:hypothetical protein
VGGLHVPEEFVLVRCAFPAAGLLAHEVHLAGQFKRLRSDPINGKRKKKLYNIANPILNLPNYMNIGKIDVTNNWIRKKTS